LLAQGNAFLPSPDYYARVRPAGLTLNINLTTLQLPPDTYSGTLFLQAQAI